MSTSAGSTRAVFISHSAKDAAEANRICERLEARGLACWIAPRDVRPGSSYGEEIVHAIEAADALVLVLSESANESRAVANEVERAFANRKLVVPVRLSDVKPSKALEFFVSTCQWIDAWGGGFESAMDVLDAAVRASRTGQGVAAPVVAPAPARAARGGRHKALALAAGVLLVAGLIWGVVFHSGQGAGPGGDGMRGGDLAPPGGDTGQDAPIRYEALVVGISDYADHGAAGWSDLVSARDDATAVADLLEREYGFRVRRLMDGAATRSALVAALDGLADLSDRCCALVYFAGHGFFDKARGEGYWIPADARRSAGTRQAKEDWVWNSTVAKIVTASGARHVLVMADSCYAGSLFRGEAASAPGVDSAWYRRAMASPSRYLIASGGLEPVPDSAGRHSVFAGQVVNYLRSGAKPVFSASDLAVAVREKVKALTGQMVQMGPLASVAHAGGEFVFVHRSAARELAALAQPPPGLAEDVRRDAPAAASAGRQTALQEALTLSAQGATNAAGRVLALLGKPSNEDRLTQAVVAYLDQERRRKSHDGLKDLVERIEKRRAAQAGAGSVAVPDGAKPRVLVCLGPMARDGGADAESQAALYRICLRSEMEALGGARLVEREALEQILQEMNLGTSELADARASLHVGKLLPAGLLLLGDLMVTAQGDRLFLRLVDTETTGVLASFSARRGPDDDVAAACSNLATQVMGKIAELKPLTARVASVEAKRLRAGLGRFHGARAGMAFRVIRRAADGKETAVGTASLAETGDGDSSFEVQSVTDLASLPAAELWVREDRSAAATR
jgi:uncharacterized caspase-like protein